MLQAARLAPQVLGESAGLVRAFFQRSQNEDGGFRDRAGRSDLYYTVFGLEGLLALEANLPSAKTESFLRPFAGGAGLDLVHLACLARCWAALGGIGALREREEAVRHIGSYRTPDGGYRLTPNADRGTAYGCFLALAAHQDLGVELPDAAGLARCLAALRRPDGGWSNAVGAGFPGDRLAGEGGSTLATAAAVTVLRHLGESVEARARDWLLARGDVQGGFRATPSAPLPDLLSTAGALHALAGLGVSFSARAEACLDFVDSLWTNAGGFHGHWADDHLDCEYTFYGLLALGHLSL